MPEVVQVVHTSSRRWHPRRLARRPITWVGLVVLLAAAYVVVLAAPATVVSEDDALASFRERAAGDAGGDDATAATETTTGDDAVEAGTDAARPTDVEAGSDGDLADTAPTDAGTEPEDGADPRRTTSPGDDGPGTTTGGSTGTTTGAATEPAGPTTPTATYAPPPQGVYVYDVTGQESIDAFGAERTYPERATATVLHEGGCASTWELTLVEEHVEETRSCVPADGASTMRGFSQAIEFLGVREVRDLPCSPEVPVSSPPLAPGDETAGRCEDADDGMVADVTVTQLGRGEVDVGGVTVAAVHVAMRLELSGSSDGRSDLDLWLAADSGLVLRMDRTTDTMVETQLGRRRYRERLTIELADLTPRT